MYIFLKRRESSNYINRNAFGNVGREIILKLGIFFFDRLNNTHISNISLTT